MEVSGFSATAKRQLSSLEREREGGNFLEMNLLFCPSLFTLKLNISFTSEDSSVLGS